MDSRSRATTICYSFYYHFRASFRFVSKHGLLSCISRSIFYCGHKDSSLRIRKLLDIIFIFYFTSSKRNMHFQMMLEAHFIEDLFLRVTGAADA